MTIRIRNLADQSWPRLAKLIGKHDAADCECGRPLGISDGPDMCNELNSLLVDEARQLVPKSRKRCIEAVDWNRLWHTPVDSVPAPGDLDAVLRDVILIAILDEFHKRRNRLYAARFRSANSARQ